MHEPGTVVMKPGDFKRVEGDVPMPENSRTYRVSLFSVLFLFVVAALAPGQARQQVADKSTKSASAPVAIAPSSDGSKYVGTETCKTCHEDIYNAWEKTPHWKTTLNKEAPPSHQGCEGCHGPGADHVAGGGDKSKIFAFKDDSRQETSARCLACHGEGHEQSHFAQSAHASSDVGCLDCHSPHHAKAEQHLLVQKQPAITIEGGEGSAKIMHGPGQKISAVLVVFLQSQIGLDQALEDFVAFRP